MIQKFIWVYGGLVCGIVRLFALCCSELLFSVWCLKSLKKIGKDELILMLCVMVFLSYLPEAGEYSCFFVYLRLVRFLHFHICCWLALIILTGRVSIVTWCYCLHLKLWFNSFCLVRSTLFDVRQLSSENYVLFLCSRISDFDTSVFHKASFVKSVQHDLLWCSTFVHLSGEFCYSRFLTSVLKKWPHSLPW